MTRPFALEPPLEGVMLPSNLERLTIAGTAIQEQERRHWCWAAVGASVARALGYAKLDRQLSVAHAALGKSLGPGDASYDQPQELLGVLKAAGFNGSRVPGFLGEAATKRRIAQRRPIAIALDWGGFSHAALITGVTRDGRYARVEDPSDQGHAWLPVRGLGAAYRGGARWTASFIFKRR